jgi:CheY-like chemotaxis protein
MMPNVTFQKGQQFLLIIEDDFDTANLLKIYFSAKGYIVEYTSRGWDGFRLANQLQPDLILLDIMLPDTNGFTILRELRKAPLTKDIPVIIVSQKDERSDVFLGFEVGADDYITKPFDIEEMTLRIEARLRLSNLKQTAILQNSVEMTPIFISYSRMDWDDFVNPLVSRLRKENLLFWIDQSSIYGSSDWLDDINNALLRSKRMIVCISPDALQSRYVKMEYRYAFNNGIRLYPLVCRDIVLPAELQVLHNFKYREIDKLIEVLKS